MELLYSEEAMDAKLEAFIGGSILGGMGSVTKIIGETAKSAQQNTQTKKDYGESQQELVAEALEIDPDNAYALKMQALLDKGKNLSGSQLNRLVQQNSSAAATELTSTLQETVSARLTDLGETADVPKLTEALIKHFSGVKLTAEEVSRISESRYGYAVAEDLAAANNPATPTPDWLADSFDAIPAAETQEIATPAAQAHNDNGVLSGVNGESVDPVAKLAREAVDAQYAAENGAGLDGIPSAEGKILKGDTQVDIEDIATAGGGKVTVKLADGRSVDATALEYEDSGEAELWRVIGKYAEDADSARALLEEYRSGNLDSYKYARGVEEAYLFGKLNMSPREMELQGSYVNLMDPAQRNMAYKQGRIAGEKKAQQRQDKLDAAKKKGNNKKGQLHFEGDRGKLTNRQKVSLQTCEIIAKALGIQVYVFESEKGAGTKRVGENGWYDPKDGSIHIDLHAGQNGEGVMVFTLAHELTHFIRDWSPKKFRVLSGFLAEQYAKKGQSVDLLVRQQMKKAEDDGRKLSYEEAHEEWVADSMETMLTDGTIVEKLAMLQAKDKGLVAKIKSFLDGFLKRLKAAYQGVSPQTQEGQIVGEMVDAAQELQDLFADALLDAGDNFRAAEKNTTGEGGVRFSMNYSDAIEKLNDGTLDRTDNTHLKLLDNTPQLYIDKAGAKNLKIIMAWDVAYLAMNKEGDLPGNYHGLGKEVMKQLPVAIANPLYIVKQKNGRIAAVTEIVVKGKRPVFASIELDTYKATRQDGVNEEDNYNLVVTVMNARINYLKNTIFSGEIVYNKNNEAPANFILRLNSLNKALPNDDLAEASKSSIRDPDGIVKENDSTAKRTSSRNQDGVSSRELLLQAFENTVANSKEYEMLQEYKEKVAGLNRTEDYVDGLTKAIGKMRKELQKKQSSDPQNTDAIESLKAKIETYVQSRSEAVKLLNKYDQQLIYMENNPLRGIIRNLREASWEKGYKKAQEYYQESRRKAVERHNQAEVRQRIRKDVQRLDSLLNKGTKEKNVKLELKEFAGAALRLAKGTATALRNSAGRLL